MSNSSSTPVQDLPAKPLLQTVNPVPQCLVYSDYDAQSTRRWRSVSRATCSRRTRSSLPCAQCKRIGWHGYSKYLLFTRTC